jgi:hypothetical protein
MGGLNLVFTISKLFGFDFKPKKVKLKNFEASSKIWV